MYTCTHIHTPFFSPSSILHSTIQIVHASKLCPYTNHNSPMHTCPACNTRIQHWDAFHTNHLLPLALHTVQHTILLFNIQMHSTLTTCSPLALHTVQHTILVFNMEMHSTLTTCSPWHTVSYTILIILNIQMHSAHCQVYNTCTDYVFNTQMHSAHCPVYNTRNQHLGSNPLWALYTQHK